MIEETHVSFEVAKLLKEKGFDGKSNRVYQGPKLKYTTLDISPLMCLGELGGFDPKDLYITNSELGDLVYTAPTQQMAMKWLREVHNICITIYPDKVKGYEAVLYNIKDDVEIILQSFGIYGYHIFEDSYEQACEVALKYTLENLI